MGLGDCFVKLKSRNVKLYLILLKHFQHNVALLQVKEDIVSSKINKDISTELNVIYINKSRRTH